MAASTALDMLSLMPGLIAGSALTKSAKQVPNVVTQVSAAACGYVSGGNLNEFGKCMVLLWTPVAMGVALGSRGTPIDMTRNLVRVVRIKPWGFAVAVA